MCAGLISPNGTLPSIARAAARLGFRALRPERGPPWTTSGAASRRVPSARPMRPTW